MYRRRESDLPGPSPWAAGEYLADCHKHVERYPAVFLHPVQQEGAKAAVLRNGRFQRPYFFALRVVRLI